MNIGYSNLSDSITVYSISTDDSVNEFYSVILQSDTLLKKSVIKLGRKGTNDEIEDIREKLKFTTIDKTDILQIECYFEKEKFACAFLDTLVNTLNSDAMAKMKNNMQKKVNHIDSLLEEVTLKLQEAEDLLKKDGRQILNLAEESDEYFEQFIKLEANQNILQKLKECLKQKEDACLTDEMNLAIDLDEFLEKALGDLYKLIIERNQIQCPTKSSEDCKNINKKIKELKSNLDIYLKNSLAAISEEIEQYEAIIKKLPKSRVEMTRQFDVNQKIYEYLLEKKTELLIGGAGIFYPIRKIDRARWERK